MSWKFALLWNDLQTLQYLQQPSPTERQAAEERRWAALQAEAKAAAKVAAKAEAEATEARPESVAAYAALTQAVADAKTGDALDITLSGLDGRYEEGLLSKRQAREFFRVWQAKAVELGALAPGDVVEPGAPAEEAEAPAEEDDPRAVSRRAYEETLAAGAPEGEAVCAASRAVVAWEMAHRPADAPPAGASGGQMTGWWRSPRRTGLGG